MDIVIRRKGELAIHPLSIESLALCRLHTKPKLLKVGDRVYVITDQGMLSYRVAGMDVIKTECRLLLDDKQQEKFVPDKRAIPPFAYRWWNGSFDD